MFFKINNLSLIESIIWLYYIPALCTIFSCVKIHVPIGYLIFDTLLFEVIIEFWLRGRLYVADRGYEFYTWSNFFLVDIVKQILFSQSRRSVTKPEQDFFMYQNQHFPLQSALEKIPPPPAPVCHPDRLCFHMHHGCDTTYFKCV